MKAKTLLAPYAAVVLSVALVNCARGAITVDGTLDGGYGSALAVQTINTGFGDSTIGDGTSAFGSELDAAYGVVQGGNLYLFLSGNFEANGNHVNIFISDGRAGQGVLSLPATGTMHQMNNSLFSPGFQATYALDLNVFSGAAYVEEYPLTGPVGGYVGFFGLTGGIGTGSPGGSITYGLNNKNAAGVNGNSGTAANAAAALAVNTGLEVAIPLSLLGNPSGNISVLADINGGGDSYLSNQFLPGLAVGSGNVGSAGQLTLIGTPGAFFVVSVPEPSAVALMGLALVTLLAKRRK